MEALKNGFFSDEFLALLYKARMQGYASGVEAVKRQDGGKEFTFRINSGENIVRGLDPVFLYKDRYYGFDPFFGRELAWVNGKVVWGMNYYGETLASPSMIYGISPDDIYAFLRLALCQLKGFSPRGPLSFEKEDFSYSDITEDVKNGFLSFRGKEFITYKSCTVYRCHYHGGVILEKGECDIV